MLTDPSVLDLASGESITFRARRWTLDQVELRPQRGGHLLQVRALRLFPSDFRPGDAPAYFDLVSQTAIDSLLVWLERSDYASRLFTLTKLGDGPASRWTLGVQAALA